jgi:membrane protein YqaA with SNARE-associated domain
MVDQDQPEMSTTSTPLADKSKFDWKVYTQRAFAVFFAIGITVVIYIFRDQIQQYDRLGYPGVFLLSAVGNATLLFPAPAFAVVFAVGSVLNPYLVGISGGCGAALGEMTGYLAGFGGRGVIEDKPVFKRLETLMRKWGAWIVFVLALIPNPLFDVGGLMAGALKMPWWKFLLAAAAGKSLRFILLALLGASIL